MAWERISRVCRGAALPSMGLTGRSKQGEHACDTRVGSHSPVVSSRRRKTSVVKDSRKCTVMYILIICYRMKATQVTAFTGRRLASSTLRQRRTWQDTVQGVGITWCTGYHSFPSPKIIQPNRYIHTGTPTRVFSVHGLQPYLQSYTANNTASNNPANVTLPAEPSRMGLPPLTMLGLIVVRDVAVIVAVPVVPAP